MIRLFIVIFVCFLLTGCFEEKQEETKSVSWYIENSEARKEKLTECKDNPGELEKTPNCINATKAELKSSSKGKTTRF